MTTPRSPAGAGPAGRRIWRAITAQFDLDAHELVLVTALARQADRLDELEKLIAEEGLTVTGHGTTKMHPAVVEARQTAIAIARISAALRLPAGEQDDQAPPQHRGVRGVYSFRPAG